MFTSFFAEIAQNSFHPAPILYLPLIRKRFKKRAGFLPNAPEMQFGLRIARYFNRFSIFSLHPASRSV